MYFIRTVFLPKNITSENKIQENISSKKYLIKIIQHEQIQSEKYYVRTVFLTKKIISEPYF